MPVDRDKHRAGDRVEPQIEPRDGGRDVGVDAELLDVEGVHGEHVPVRLVALRRRGAAEVLGPVVVAHLERAVGQPAPPRAPADSAVTDAGMSITSQCQNPEPVGASGS